MIEAQQQLIDTTEHVDMLPLPSDAALGNFRLLMQRTLEAERADSRQST